MILTKTRGHAEGHLELWYFGKVLAPHVTLLLINDLSKVDS